MIPYFIAEDQALVEDLSSAFDNVIFYPSYKTMWKMLRSQTVVVDGNEWTNNFKVFFLMNAKKVQLWHGNGMKTIGLENAYYLNSPVRRMKFKLLQSYPIYDIVTLPSKLQIEKRGDAFNKKEVMLNGQPRNDVLFNQFHDSDQVNYGIDEEAVNKISKLKRKGYKLVLYSPTWKLKTEAAQHKLTKSLNLEKMEPFLKKNKIVFIFKLHPKDVLNYGQLNNEAFMTYHKDKDVYPAMKHIDVMITDYSSIYLDSILLDRPMIFFSYDQDEYIKNERALQYDYDQITPGKKCKSTNELIDELETLLVWNEDAYITFIPV